jgi:multidrug resistance efflux pump
VSVANSNLAAGRAQVSNLNVQLEAARRLAASLEERLALLESKRARFALVAPVTGTLFGEDLTRTLGQYFAKGAEICRIADTRQLLVRVQVAEQSLGDIAVGQGVRVKTRAFPDRVFRGVVSRIGGESELDPNGVRTYRVELTIQNPDGLLRPGMTVFARVDFGRRAVAWLLAHKFKQALRPELWML